MCITTLFVGWHACTDCGAALVIVGDRGNFTTEVLHAGRQYYL